MSDLSKVLKTAESFDKNPSIATAKSFIELSSLLERVISAINEVKNEPTVNAQFLTDNPIRVENNYEGLQEAIQAIIPALKSLKEADMSGVETLLERIADKEQKDIDLSELSSISSILSDILDATKKLDKAEKEEKKQEVKDNKKVIKAIDDVYDIINTLNENVVKADFGFDYKRLEDIISKIRVGGGGGVPSSLPLPTGAATAAKQDTQTGYLQALNSLAPSVYDYISLAYTGDNLTTVIFKLGGSGGTVVSTLTLAYSGTDLISVTKS